MRSRDSATANRYEPQPESSALYKAQLLYGHIQLYSLYSQGESTTYEAS